MLKVRVDETYPSLTRKFGQEVTKQTEMGVLNRYGWCEHLNNCIKIVVKCVLANVAKMKEGT